MTQTKLNPLQTNDNILSSSIFRQALINGNFDVWQRGTSSTTAGAGYYTADRFARYDSADGGTAPTVTTSRQAITPGALANSFYCFRQAPNGAGTSLGANAEGSTFTKIENGTRYLCGDGKKITLSFWAKSDLASKKIGIWLNQNYGTGGSPTSAEALNGTTFTLTSSWQKFTYTFTTNTLSGKTFGTANDDYLQVVFMIAWGSGFSTKLGGASAENWGGNGFIDIAQVQLCAGDVALPFMPKSYSQELLDCQRYCVVFGGTNLYENIGLGVGAITTVINSPTLLPVKMRTVPTLTVNGTWQTGSGSDFSSVALSPDQSSPLVALFQCTGTGFTVGSVYQIRSKNSTSNLLILSAEL